jgi:uncharacterized protein YjiS (DUF1127 family)
MTKTNTLLLMKEAVGQSLNDIPNYLSQCPSDLGCSVLQVWHAYRSYRERSATGAQLMALDDDMLKNIGLDRSEIDSVLLDTSRERRRGTR